MKRALVIIALGGLLTAGCSEGTGPASAGSISLSFASGAPSPLTSARLLEAAGDPLVIATATDTVRIDSVMIVLKEIELKATGVDTCMEEDDCGEFELGPFLLDLDLGAGANQEFAIDLAAGSYSEIEFEIHKVSSGDSEDAAFIAAHPQMEGTSIRVTGAYNGTPFVYVTDLNAEQEIALTSPILVDSNTTMANVTIVVDVSTWFLDGAGALVDPSSANNGGANESLVRNNIRDSFRGFEDDDHDGEDDDAGF